MGRVVNKKKKNHIKMLVMNILAYTWLIEIYHVLINALLSV